MRKIEQEAYAIITNKLVPKVGMTSQYCVHTSKAMAEEQVKNMMFVIGRGYKPRVIKCTITYYLK